MIRDLAIDASILGDHKGSLVFLNYQRTEVIVHAAHIASSLIEPAAGMVDRSCGIGFSNDLFDPERVKLSPALIKRNPESDARIVIQLTHHADDVPLEAPPRLLILSHEQFVMVVAQMLPYHKKTAICGRS